MAQFGWKRLFVTCLLAGTEHNL